MSFLRFDEILIARAGSRGQTLEFSKLPADTPAQGRWHSLWKATGLPSAGSSTSAGLANAAVLTKSSPGAILYENAAGGAKLFLHGMEAISLKQPGTLLLVDRIAHVNIANNQATGNFSPALDATSRLSAGEGAQLVVEVTSQLGASPNTRSFSYTNQAGVSGRVTPNVIHEASADVGQIYLPEGTGIFHPLFGTDSGVRSVEATSLVSGSATGNIDVSLVKPLGYISMSKASQVTARDFVIEIPTMPRIQDDMCLSLYWLQESAGLSLVSGTLYMAEQ